MVAQINERHDFYQGINVIGPATFSQAFVDTEHLAAGLQVPASNQVHRIYCTAANQAGTVASARTPIHIAKFAGTIAHARISPTQTAAAGAATVDVDIYVNGSSVMSAAMQITSSTTARAKVDGTVSSPSYAAGDVIEAVVTATAGGGTLPVGLAVDLALDEASQ